MDVFLEGCNVDSVRDRLNMYASRISSGSLHHHIRFCCEELSNTTMYDLFHVFDCVFMDIDYGVFSIDIIVGTEWLTCWFEVTRIFCGKVVYLYDKAAVVHSCMDVVQFVSAALNICKVTVFRICSNPSVCYDFAIRLLREGPTIVFYDRFNECMRAYFGPALDFKVSVEQEESEEEDLSSVGAVSAEEIENGDPDFIYT